MEKIKFLDDRLLFLDKCFIKTKTHRKHTKDFNNRSRVTNCGMKDLKAS